MTLTRRRFLTIASAACFMAPAVAKAYVWQGITLGAKARIILDHPRAEAICARAIAEIDRLENVFSLYRPDSQLSRLNASGRLDEPAFELLTCLSTARRVNLASAGRFDPTVQPLWRLLADAREENRRPDAASMDRARRAIGFDRVRFGSDGVFLDAHQALTLNGIAQGAIADSVADLMRNEGVDDVLIDTGEILALGAGRGQDGWPVGIAGGTQSRMLRNRALATSAPRSLMLDEENGLGHILDPGHHLDAPSSAPRQVSVSAPSGALADALSTALCMVGNEKEALQILRSVKDANLEAFYTSA